MNKVFVFIFFCINSFNIYAQLKLRDLPYDIDTLYKENGLGKQGLWIDAGRDSVVMRIANYINDTLDGYETFYHKNGQISSKCFFIKGKVDGYAVSYRENGSILAYGYCKNGKLHGVTTMYDSAGKVILKERYVDGELDLTYDSTYNDGTIITETPMDINDTINEFVLYPDVVRKSIYHNKILVKERLYFYNVLNSEDIYENGIHLKKIIYFKKSENIVKKVFHYNDNDILYKTEFFNKKGDLKKVKYVKIKNKS
jgi:antitoxin component YwqK of YwqJK toxin-antitoxin module